MRDGQQEAPGWGRALGIAAGILLVGAALLLLVPQLLVSHLPGSRLARELFTTVWFVAALAGFTWRVRRGQVPHGD